VKDVKTISDAVSIAIAEAGKRLNPALDFVEYEVGSIECPVCGKIFESVFLIAETALVGLIFEMKVYQAKNEEHASRIAKSVIGKALGKIPLKVIGVREIEV